MIPFLACGHQHHKGGVTFFVILLPNVMTKCPSPTDLEAEWMMIPFLTCSHQHHKGVVTFYVILLPNVMTKCLSLSQIWLHMQPTWEQNLIVQFEPFDYGEKLIHDIGTWNVWSHEVEPHVELFVLHFTFCFVKALRWWGVTRFAQPHVHMNMFCPCVIPTLYHLLEELQIRTFKRYFSHAILLTILHLRDMN
jgi:hypothetical protein